MPQTGDQGERARLHDRTITTVCIHDRSIHDSIVCIMLVRGGANCTRQLLLLSANLYNTYCALIHLFIHLFIHHLMDKVEELAGQLGDVHKLTRSAFDEKMEKEVTRLR
jgi:hypothetical protein